MADFIKGIKTGIAAGIVYGIVYVIFMIIVTMMFWQSIGVYATEMIEAISFLLPGWIIGGIIAGIVLYCLE